MMQSEKKVVIHCDHVSKTFYNMAGDHLVVDDLNFDVYENEFVVLFGPGQCGKSTVLNLIAGLEEPAGGKVVVSGEEVKGPSPKRGMVYQTTNLFMWYNVMKNVEFGPWMQGVSKKERRARAQHYIDLVGLTGFEKHYPVKLSGGMQQRVMIAMAIACAPKLLIADEPTTALDVTIQAQILKLMNDLKREHGTSILFITHDLGVIAQMADDVAVMYCGQVVELAPASTLFDPKSEYSHPYTEGLMLSVPRLDTPAHQRLETIPGSVPHPLDLPKGCKFAPRCKYATDKCREQEPTMTCVSDKQQIRCFYPSKEERHGKAK